jgi:hypothetical protein
LSQIMRHVLFVIILMWIGLHWDDSIDPADTCLTVLSAAGVYWLSYASIAYAFQNARVAEWQSIVGKWRLLVLMIPGLVFFAAFNVTNRELICYADAAMAGIIASAISALLGMRHLGFGNARWLEKELSGFPPEKRARRKWWLQSEGLLPYTPLVERHDVVRARK